MPNVTKPDYSPYSSIPYGNVLEVISIVRAGDLLAKKAELFGHAFVIQGYIGATGILQDDTPVPVLAYDANDEPAIEGMSLEQLCNYAEAVATPPAEGVKQGVLDALFAKVAAKLVQQVMDKLMDLIMEKLSGE